MKKMAVLAMALAVSSGITVAADLSGNDNSSRSARLDLAMQDTGTSSLWTPSRLRLQLERKVNQEQAASLSDNVARVSAQLDQQLEDRIEKDLISAM